MLVLSRQRDETIMIGDDVEITVVDIRGDKVRLGINAPTRIAVHRKEVYEAIRAENQRAAQLTGSDADLLRRRLNPAAGGGAGGGMGVPRPHLATSARVRHTDIPSLPGHGLGDAKTA